MAVNLSPVFQDAQFTSSGALLNGGFIYSYSAGSSTPLASYTDNTGATPQANPITLNARGEVASPIWLTSGLSYKLRLFDASNNFIREFDNVKGVNDTTLTIDQWTSPGLTPTYVSATQFTLAGDQTSAFHVGRRVKYTVTAGTGYGRISVTAFAALTTVTVVNDAGRALDSGLSAVQIGLITADNTSFPVLKDSDFKLSGSADKTKLYSVEVDTNVATATTVTKTAQGISGTEALVEDQIKPISATVAASALTITLNPCSLAFRSSTIGSGTVAVRAVNTAITVVVPSTATLGTVSAAQSRLAVLAIDNAGTVELAVINIAGGVDLSETGIISTTTIAGASNSASTAYSTTGRASVAYRVVGYVESTQATAGTWATAPSTIQGIGGQVRLVGTSMVRLNTANGYGSTNTVIRRFTTTVTNQGADITYADSATNGATFTINSAGVYAISYSDIYNTTAVIGLSLNSNQLTTAISGVTVTNVLATSIGTNTTSSYAYCGATLYMVPGDVVRAHTSGAATGTPTNSTQFIIVRVS